jgi:FtsH-binding integral membrane protein
MIHALRATAFAVSALSLFVIVASTAYVLFIAPTPDEMSHAFGVALRAMFAFMVGVGGCVLTAATPPSTPRSDAV